MRRILVLVVLVALAGPPAWSTGAVSAQEGVPIGGTVRFEPGPGTTLSVEGRGPYHGAIEVRRSSGGLLVVNDLELESYVMGINEVPASWPLEALKAQAVAARTYALWERENGVWARHGFDVCATTACQVYGGAIVERRRNGHRWIRAVRETEGEVLLDGDQPILARYHASSGGRTLDNETVYPSSGARSYLVAVDDEADEVSPLHRWQVDFTREQMQEILRAGIGLAGTLVEIRSDQEARRALVRTEGGEIELSTVRLRRVVSEHAPRLYPDAFPGPRPDGLLMPLTLPSSRYDVETTRDGFRFRGRGYGHGVGMSQWGAKGRAERGEDHREILSAYYGGLEPRVWEGPTRMRVALARDASDAAILGDGPFAVLAGSDELAASTLGAWGVEPGGSGTMRVLPPEGFDLPLVLSGLEVPDRVVIGPENADGVEMSFVLPKAAEVEAVLTRDGDQVASADGVFDAGPGRLRVPVDPETIPRRAGYTMTLRAFDGEETVTRSADLGIERPRRVGWLPLLVAIVLLGLAGRAVVRDRRRRDSPPSGPGPGAGPEDPQSSTIPVRGHPVQG